jgi:hypothetical protein
MVVAHLYNAFMADKKKKSPKKKPDGRGPRPRDPNQLAKWVMEQSTTPAEAKSNQKKLG